MLLQIGTSEPAALGGITEAVIAQAASYSRAIESKAVVAPTARSLGLSPKEVSSHVSASPVAQSGNIIVTATGSSPRAAIRLANAVSTNLIRYVALTSNPGVKPAAILTKYESAAVTVRSLKRGVERIAARVRGGAKGETLARLEGRLQAALLQQETLRTEYQRALLAPTTRLIAFDHPTTASNDRRSKAALLGFIGLLFGIVVGFVAVSLGARRSARLAHPA
jgi:hypothetical protein